MAKNVGDRAASIPLAREVMVKRWLLKEEIRVRRRTVQRTHRERHVLRNEQAVIESEPPTPKERDDG